MDRERADEIKRVGRIVAAKEMRMRAYDGALIELKTKMDALQKDIDSDSTYLESLMNGGPVETVTEYHSELDDVVHDEGYQPHWGLN